MDLDAFLKDHVAKSEQQTTFFHFTDTRNLDLIKKHGLLSRRKLKELGIQIPAPGGNQWSMESADRLGLDRYVSLCLFKKPARGGSVSARLHISTVWLHSMRLTQHVRDVFIRRMIQQIALSQQSHLCPSGRVSG